MSYSDLDLSRSTGATIMLARIHQAASTACGGWPDARELGRWVAYRACTAEAVNGAVAKLNAPLVSSLYGKQMRVAERR